MRINGLDNNQQPIIPQQNQMGGQPFGGGFNNQYNSPSQMQPQMGGLSLEKQPNANGVVCLNKGEGITLTKMNPYLTQVKCGLGWDFNNMSGLQFDLDVSVFELDYNGRVFNGNSICFYGQQVSPDGAIRHSGDNRTGVGDGDDESLTIQLSNVNPAVTKLLFVVTIDKAIERQQRFSMVRNAYIRIVDTTTNRELSRFDLSQQFGNSTALIMGSLDRVGTDWKFNAISTEEIQDLRGLCMRYGVAVG